MIEEGDVDQVSEGERLMEEQFPSGKRVTLERIIQRIGTIRVLNFAVIIFILGFLLCLADAFAMYNWYEDPEFGEDMGFIVRFGEVLVGLFYYLFTLITGYVALTIAYRARYGYDEDGEPVKKSLDFHRGGENGIHGSLSIHAVLFFVILMVLAFLDLILGFWIRREKFDLSESLSLWYITNLLYSFIRPIIPVALLYLVISDSRGLLRINRYSTFLFVVIIGSVVNFIIRIIYTTEYYIYYKDLIDFTSFAEMYEISNFTQNYAAPFMMILGALMFGLVGFILSNMKFGKKAGFRFDPTPGGIMILIGMIMNFISAAIYLTVFNTDFDYSGDYNGFYGWSIFLNQGGGFFLMGGILLLLVEYSLARKVLDEDLDIMPNELWEEVKEQNPFFG